MAYWDLYENGYFLERFTSHTKAKNAMHWKIVEAEEEMLDLNYELKKVEGWKEKGFRSQREYDEYLNEMYEDIRGGFI